MLRGWAYGDVVSWGAGYVLDADIARAKGTYESMKQGLCVAYKKEQVAPEEIWPLLDVAPWEYSVVHADGTRRWIPCGDEAVERLKMEAAYIVRRRSGASETELQATPATQKSVEQKRATPPVETEKSAAPEARLAPIRCRPTAQ